MKIDINKHYKTRDGQDVKIYTTEHKGDNPVVGALVGSVLGHVYFWGEDGYNSHDPDLDLIEVKPEQVVWIAAYETGTMMIAGVDAEPLSSFRDQFTGTLYRVPPTDDMVVE